jgi:quaternary ammonium compound-resistance protein SugE
MSGVLKSAFQAIYTQRSIILIALVLGNLAFNVVANTCFKVSTGSPNVRSFLFWQVIGNTAGFLTVISLTMLLRYIPLHIAFPVTTGLAVIGLQVVGSLLFRETIPSVRWIGTLLVIMGIVMLSR